MVLVTVAILVPVTTSLEAEDRLQVLVITGQSNSAYRGDSVDLNIVNDEIPQPKTNTYYYGTTNGPIYYGGMPPYGEPSYDTTFESYGIHSMTSNGSWIIGGYEPALAQSISAKTNCDVLIINAGISAASIGYLLPDQTGGEYVEQVITRALNLIKDDYKIINKIGYCWMQGETDKNNPVSEYIEKFDTIFDWYQDLGFDRCFMVKTRDINGGNSCEAQIELARDNPNIILASTAPDTFTVANGLMNADNLHYTQEGRIIIAEDINSKMVLKSYLTDNTLADLLGFIPLLITAGIIIIIGGSIAIRRLE